VRAGLRRNARGAGEPNVLKIGGIEVDLAKRAARGPTGEVHLTPLEYRLLESFVRNAGMIVRQAQLIREVWGPGHADDARGLRVCIKNLRDKLEPDPRRPRYFITEVGLGYRFRG